MRAHFADTMFGTATSGSVRFVSVIPHATVNVYQEGTTTPVTPLYADDTSSTTLPNPLTADAYGYVSFFTDQAQRVSLTISAPGYTTQNRISDVVSLTGLAGPAGPQGPTGPAGTQGPQGPQGLGIWFNVKDYGAVGNGVANDTSAIQLAINAAGAARGKVYFPAGVYLVSPDSNGYCLYMDSFDYMSLKGDGGKDFASTIRCTTNTATGVLSVGAHSGRLVQCPIIEDLCFQCSDGSAAYGTSTGVAVDFNATSITMRGCTAQYVGGSYFIGLKTSGTQESFDNVFFDCYIYIPLTDTTDGVLIQPSSGGSITDTEFVLFKADGAKPAGGNGGRYAFNLAPPANNVESFQFELCHPYFWQTGGYNISGAIDTLIHGGQCETNGVNTSGFGIQLIGGIRVVIHDVLFYNNQGADILVLSSSSLVNIHDNVFQGSTNNNLVHNIYVGASDHNIIAQNIMRKGTSSGFADNVKLDTGVTRTKVLGNNYDTLLTEAGTATGTRNNAFGGWNDGPVTSITKVDTSTTIGADNTQV